MMGDGRRGRSVGDKGKLEVIDDSVNHKPKNLVGEKRLEPRGRGSRKIVFKIRGEKQGGLLKKKRYKARHFSA